MRRDEIKAIKIFSIFSIVLVIGCIVYSYIPMLLQLLTIDLFTCIFTGIIAFSSIYMVLFGTIIYDGRNCLVKCTDKRRKEEGLSTTPPVSLWKAMSAKISDWKMRRIIKKSK